MEQVQLLNCGTSILKARGGGGVPQTGSPGDPAKVRQQQACGHLQQAACAAARAIFGSMHFLQHPSPCSKGVPVPRGGGLSESTTSISAGNGAAPMLQGQVGWQCSGYKAAPA